MTCIVALKKDGVVHIGSDSIVITENEISRGRRKIVSFPGFKVGFAGDYLLFHILEEMAKDFTIVTVKDARDFAIGVFAALKDELGEDCEDFKENALLIATSTDIFEVDTYLVCLRQESYGAIGTGAAAARPTIEIMLKNKYSEDPREILGMAITMADHFYDDCGLPAYIEEVKYEQPAKPRKHKNRGGGEGETKSTELSP